MAKGLEAGYSEREVMMGVIKAMKPGTLRNYCETAGPDLDADEFRELLHTYSEVENSMTLLSRLNNSRQGDDFADEKEKEKEKDYVLRMSCLRKAVMKVAEEEGMQLSGEMVSSCFQRALSVGFQRDVIRLQVQNILTSFPNISDNDLLKKVNAIMAMDKENREKTGKSAAVKSLNAWQGEIPHFPTRRTETNNQLDELSLQMQSMNVNMTELVKSRKEEMDEMRERIKSLEMKIGASDGARRREYPKCQKCKDENKNYCSHCAKCGESGHRQRDCPKNA